MRYVQIYELVCIRGHSSEKGILDLFFERQHSDFLYIFMLAQHHIIHSYFLEASLLDIVIILWDKDFFF